MCAPFAHGTFCATSPTGNTGFGTMRRSTGFTLIELVIVIAILAVLAAVAVPRYLNLQAEAYRASLASHAGNFGSALQIVRMCVALRRTPTNDNIPCYVGITGAAQIDVHATSGYPTDTTGNSNVIGTTTAVAPRDRCMRVFSTILTSPAPVCANTAGSPCIAGTHHFRVESIGTAQVCRYGYFRETGGAPVRWFDYNSLTGQITVVNP